MKERVRLSSGNMLLLELLFALIFFSLTLSVTLSVFGEAYVLSRQAEGRDMAVAEANDVAEIIRSAEYISEIEGLLSQKGLVRGADGQYTGEYSDSKYGIVVSTSVSGRLYTADIACYDFLSDEMYPASAIYELKVEHAVKDGMQVIKE